MAEGAEGTRTAWQRWYTKSCDSHVTAAIVKTNNKVAQINFKISEADIRMWLICHNNEHPAHPRFPANGGRTSPPPYSKRAIQQTEVQKSVEAAAGSTTWEWKLILFTFNLPFPPLQNLERAKSCNTRIKSKCSRNGPTGSRQQEAFAAWPRWPAARSNRYAQFSNTYSQITITRIWTSSPSRKNKGADFLRPCEF